jgi:two-component system, LytTR family, sensor kinase
MKIPRFKEIRIYLLHFLFWVGVWFFFLYFFSYNSDDIRYVRWFSSLLLPLTIAITYFAVYFLVPKYLLEKKYGKFLLYSFYTLLGSSYMIVLIIYGCLILVLKFDATNIPPMSKNFFSVLVLVYLVVVVISFISILNHHFGTEKKNKELQNKILETQLKIKEQELRYLKMQIHPHFLFNTLNTIYGLALKQSEQAPEIILKLSNLLDYILYQINKPRVSLVEELRHIQEYIELEKIRFQDSLIVKQQIDDINEGIEIAPMLLIPFVENAFKHGGMQDGQIEIEMSVTVKDNQLDFSLDNTVSPVEEKNGKHGIGLENIRKRLELHYESNYELVIQKKADKFHVNLSIFDLNALKDA